MPIIKAGTYRFNDELSKPYGNYMQSINFTISVAGNLAKCDSMNLLHYVSTNSDVNYEAVEVKYNVVDCDAFVSLGEELPVLCYVYECVYGATGGTGWSTNYGDVEGLQLVTILKDSDVTEEFATWFTANTKEQKQISGKWKFNDVLTRPSVNLNENVNFEFPFIDLLSHQDVIAKGYNIHTGRGIDESEDYYWGSLFYRCILTFSGGSSFDQNRDVYGEEDEQMVWSTGDATEEINYQIVDFGSNPQNVSVVFYDWVTTNAKQYTTFITYNGSTVAELQGGQKATLKCAGMNMATDVVVEVADSVGGGSNSGGGESGNGATVVPLTVTENGVYDAPYYETATEVWDNNTEYSGSVTVDGVTLSFKKADNLIVPDDLYELENSKYVAKAEYTVDGETTIHDYPLNNGIEISDGIVAVFEDFSVLWVKNATPLNAQYNISFLEDNTVYITNYAQLMLGLHEGAEYVKMSVTAPSKKIDNVAYSPVTVELPIHAAPLVVTPRKYQQEWWYGADNVYYDRVVVKAIPDDYIIPNGTKTITENGTYDVKSYESVDVAVSENTGGGSSGGDVNQLNALIDRTITEISSNATSVGAHGFSYCENLTTVDLPNATSIDSYGFNFCKNLLTADFPNVISIENNAFEYCIKLTTANFPNVTSIGNRAFASCSSLSSVNFPNVTSIGDNAFFNCTKLTEFTFKTKATSISSTAFTSCTKLLTINVPWAEGEVANAPWGATKASVCYNYTGD